MDVLAQFQRLNSGQDRPLHAVLELTTACNFSCNHCYNFDRSKPAPRNNERPLRVGEWLRIIDELSELGVMYVSFSGGEATLNRDLLELCTHASKAGMLVGLKSNGLRLTPKFFAELLEHNLTSLEVTLYGLSPETQDAFVGVKGAFEQVVNNLQYIQCEAPELALTVYWAVLEHNAHEYPTRRNFHRETGIALSPSSACSVRHGGDTSSLNYKVTPAQREAFGIFPKSAETTAAMSSEEHFTCGCAQTSFAISAKGEVWPCIGVPWRAGSIQEKRLGEIWKNSPVFQKIRNFKFSDYEPCASCELLQICDRRNSSAFKASGSFTGPDIHSGRDAEEQAHRLGINGRAACLVDSSERLNSESA